MWRLLGQLALLNPVFGERLSQGLAAVKRLNLTSERGTDPDTCWLIQNCVNAETILIHVRALGLAPTASLTFALQLRMEHT